jgi:hypothetical protein
MNFVWFFFFFFLAFDSLKTPFWQLLKLVYHAPVTASYHNNVWAKIGRIVNPLVHHYARFLNTPISAAQCNRFFGVLGILGSEERIVRERIDYNESEKGNWYWFLLDKLAISRMPEPPIHNPLIIQKAAYSITRWTYILSIRYYKTYKRLNKTANPYWKHKTTLQEHKTQEGQTPQNATVWAWGRLNPAGTHLL